VALTFDDGPHPEGTPLVLAALDRTGAHATFFVVAEQVERHRSVVAEIVAAGHEVAVHGYRHRNQMRVAPRALAEDMRRAIAIIGDATGRAPRYFRPPYGTFTPAGLALARHANLESLLWSKWGRDWRANTTPEEIARLATRSLAPGDVILLHDADWYSARDSHRRTADALPLILKSLLYPTGSGSAAGARSQSM
jgi:peptidoglycan/xylan/chitin deacetylase (PgdA/CDA1 family)